MSGCATPTSALHWEAPGKAVALQVDYDPQDDGHATAELTSVIGTAVLQCTVGPTKCWEGQRTPPTGLPRQGALGPLVWAYDNDAKGDDTVQAVILLGGIVHCEGRVTSAVMRLIELISTGGKSAVADAEAFYGP